MAPRRTRKRRTRALLVCVLWVLGFELAPNIHVGFHELFAHHHHGDEHVGDHHDHGAEDAPSDPGHGDGSIEHRGVAITVAPPPPTIETVAAVEILIDCDAPSALPADLRPLTVRGRGPPLIACS